MQTNQPVSHREALPAEVCWRLEDIFPDDAAWQQAFESLPALLEAVTGRRGRLAESAAALAEAMRAQDELDLTLGELYVYARMRRDQNNGDTAAVERTDRIAAQAYRISAETAFVTTELTALPEGRLLELAAHPDLDVWRHRLENLARHAPHVLSEAEEALLSRFSEISGGLDDVYTMFENVDVQFGEIDDGKGGRIRLTQGVFAQLRDSPNRQVRADAFQRIHESFAAFGNTLATLYAARVKADILFARSRRHSDSLAAALFANRLPSQLYQSLIDAVGQGLPTLLRYFDLRRKRLGIEALHIYDVYVPVLDVPQRRYTYDQAKEIVSEGLAVLGDEYGRILRRHLQERWIDVYETPGKTSGAYSWGTYRSHPYILLNYQGMISDVFTLAHELGHSLHTWFSNRLPPAQADYPIFLAEIASTVNEVLLMRHLLRRCDLTTPAGRQEKAYLLNHFLEEFRGTIFRQTMFAEFELDVHRAAEEGEPLSAESLCARYEQLLRRYFGDAIVIDPYMRWEWARIPHFYRAYYVYQYATGFAAAVAFAGKILSEGQPAVDRYLEFLGGGGSDYPLELLARAGVDLSGPKPVQAAMEEMGRTLDELTLLLEEN